MEIPPRDKSATGRHRDERLTDSVRMTLVNHMFFFWFLSVLVLGGGGANVFSSQPLHTTYLQSCHAKVEVKVITLAGKGSARGPSSDLK
jgi:hypothetical protein